MPANEERIVLPRKVSEILLPEFFLHNCAIEIINGEKSFQKHQKYFAMSKNVFSEIEVTGFRIK